MGIRGLDNYLKEQGLYQNAPLSALAGSRLGIDAKEYITTLITSTNSQEPFVAAIGGVHLSLTQRVENDLQTLDRLHIKPVFIFSGLPTQNRAPPKGQNPQDENETRMKDIAWGHYEDNDTDKTIEVLKTIKGGAYPDHRDEIRSLLRLFKQRYVEYLVAPYLEQSQLAYLLNHPQGYIHAIYSSSNALLWPVDKVITSLDFPSSFSFVDKHRLVSELQISPDQFLDAGILAGSPLCRTLPLISADFSFRTVIDIIRTAGTGVSAIDQFSASAPPQMKMAMYREEFLRARQAIRHGFVLTTKGTCLPLALTIPNPQVASEADVPADIDKIFSPRLPDELYLYMCKGIISPTVLGWLTTGNVYEPLPLADSLEYQRYVQKMITENEASPRVLSLAILLDALHPQWRQRRVNAHYYFEPIHHNLNGFTVVLDSPKTAELVQQLSTWNVPFSPILQDELLRQHMSTIDIKICIGTLSKPETAKWTLEPSPRPLERKDEFGANVIWRFLTLRGFINGQDHTLSIAGQGLNTALAQTKDIDRFLDALTIVIELLRSGVLHGLYFGDEYRSGGPVGGNEQDQSSTMLIIRSMSVLPLASRPKAWVGPLSRELLVFNSFARAVSKSSRQLMEAISVHMLMTGAAKKHRDDYADFPLSLPFQYEANTGFGILFKAYLDVVLYHYEVAETISAEKANSEEAKAAKAEALSFVETNFESVKNPRAEVDRGFRFWDTIMIAVRKMAKLQESASEDIPPVFPNPEQTLEEFEMADRWLQPMRP